MFMSERVRPPTPKTQNYLFLSAVIPLCWTLKSDIAFTQHQLWWNNTFSTQVIKYWWWICHAHQHIIDIYNVREPDSKWWALTTWHARTWLPATVDTKSPSGRFTHSLMLGAGGRLDIIDGHQLMAYFSTCMWDVVGLNALDTWVLRCMKSHLVSNHKGHVAQQIGKRGYINNPSKWKRLENYLFLKTPSC